MIGFGFAKTEQSCKQRPRFACKITAVNTSRLVTNCLRAQPPLLLTLMSMAAVCCAVTKPLLFMKKLHSWLFFCLRASVSLCACPHSSVFLSLVTLMREMPFVLFNFQFIVVPQTTVISSFALIISVFLWFQPPSFTLLQASWVVSL